MFPEHIDIQKLSKGEGISDNTVKLQSEKKNHENVVSPRTCEEEFHRGWRGRSQPHQTMLRGQGERREIWRLLWTRTL